MRALRRVANGIAGLVYPRLCGVCGSRSDEVFCPDCLGDVKRVSGPHCTVCGIPFEDGSGHSHTCAACAKRSPGYDSAYAPLVYKGPLVEAVHLFKYRGMRGLAGMFTEHLRAGVEGRFGGVSAVLPVPLHKRRLAARGFNQSLVLAAAAAEALGAPVLPDGLSRIRYTRPQVGLKPRDRRANVRGAFAARKDFSGETVLIVDDVYTTGATVKECAGVLRAAGAGGVHVLTLARAV